MVLTGSCFLDTMVYPDIDLYIPRVSIPQLFQIGGQIAEHDRVFEMVFQRSRIAALPEGLYLKARVNDGAWERPWKIDIWSIAPALIERQMGPMLRFKRAMTESLREQIIRYKASIMTERHRTPVFSGFFIYKAFIDEGLTDFQAVTQYLIDNGIQVT
jgi:hypothetical protein